MNGTDTALMPRHRKAPANERKNRLSKGQIRRHNDGQNRFSQQAICLDFLRS